MDPVCDEIFEFLLVSVFEDLNLHGVDTLEAFNPHVFEIKRVKAFRIFPIFFLFIQLFAACQVLKVIQQINQKRASIWWLT